MTAAEALGDPFPCLMVHAVPATAAACRSSLDIPRGRFAEHLDALAGDGWTVVGLSRALDLAAHGAERLVAMTLDDAYADVEGAIEELAARGMGCTVFAPTDFLDGSRRAADVFAHPLLSWRGLADLPADVVELGSHGASHRPLDVLGAAQLRDELVVSRERIGERTGRLPGGVAYPYGYRSRRVGRVAAQSGYRYACSIGHRRTRPTGDPHALERLQPFAWMDGRQLIRLITSGPDGYIPTVKRALHPPWRAVRFAAYQVGMTLT